VPRDVSPFKILPTATWFELDQKEIWHHKNRHEARFPTAKQLSVRQLSVLSTHALMEMNAKAKVRKRLEFDTCFLQVVFVWRHTHG